MYIHTHIHIYIYIYICIIKVVLFNAEIPLRARCEQAALHFESCFAPSPTARGLPKTL